MGTTSKKAVTKTAPTAAPSTNTASFVNPTSPLAPEPKFTFSDAAGKFLRPVALSDVGKKYIDTLEEKFNELANNGEARVTMIAVPDLVEIRAFYNEANKLYILLYFNESYTANGVIPVVDKNADVAEYIKSAKGQDSKLLQSIVVTPDDYGRVEKMFSHLVNCFRAFNTNDQIDANVFFRMNVTPNTDIRAVREFIDRRSPHEVQDRIEWGVLLEKEVRQQQVTGYMTSKEPLRQPIIAIGGYTRFIRANTYPVGERVYPVVVITNITSDIPCSNILNLVLPVAASFAIVQGGWKRPYATFAKDKPNLGRMLKDPTKGELKFFANAEEMNAALFQFFNKEYLALDIAEGRAHIPGLECLFHEPEQFNNSATKFFGYVKDPNTGELTPVFRPVGAPLIASCINYEGSVVFEGKKEDTRNVDYLSLVSTTKTVNPQIEKFLTQMGLRDTRLRDIEAILGSDTIAPTYRCHTILFNGAFVNALATLLSSVIRYVGPVNFSNELNIAGFIQQAGAQTQIAGSNAIYGGYGVMDQPVNLY